MTRKILSLLFCLLTVGIITAQDKMRIVVFDLTPKSTEVSADSSMLSEMLRNEFIKTGRFEVVSREQTSRIMSEAEFQSAGITSEAGAIQIGKLLNVRRAIVGSVGTLGGTVFVTVQLFDLETGRFITAESMEAPTMKDIVSRMKNTVSILAGAAYRAEGVAEAPVAQGAPSPDPQNPDPQNVPPPKPRAKYPTAINFVGYGTTALGIGSVAVGYFVFNRRVDEAYKLALDAKARYDAATDPALFDGIWKEYRDALAGVKPNQQIRLVCYVAGGALTVGGLVMSFLPPPRRPVALLDKSLNLTLIPNGVYLTLSY